MRIGALAWHRKRDLTRKSVAAPARASVGRATARAPDDHTPIRLEQAEERAMTPAEIKERAADFTRWRARHRRLHPR